MSATPQRYRKLPGVSHGAGGRARLWMGEDHLLEVHSLGCVERYRRYPFDDIRAIVVEPTKIARIWTTVTAILFAVLGLIVVALFYSSNQVSDRDGMIALRIVAGFVSVGALLALLLLVVNLWRGPSCRVTIQTSGGQRVLASPTRRGKAEEIIERLSAEVAAAQSSSNA